MVDGRLEIRILKTKKQALKLVSKEYGGITKVLITLINGVLNGDLIHYLNRNKHE